MREPQTLALCIPCRANVYAQSFQYLISACVSGALWWRKQNPENKVLMISQYRAHVAAARNEIVDQALGMGANWLMWFDDDAVPPIDTISRLFAHEKAIVGPIHRKKQEPFECPAMVVDKDKGLKTPPPYDGGLHRVTYMGMHCVLVHADVYRALKRLRFKEDKWEDFIPYQDGPGMGEDVFFFQAAKAAGYDAYLDTSFTVDHMVETTVEQLRGGNDDGR